MKYVETIKWLRIISSNICALGPLLWSVCIFWCKFMRNHVFITCKKLWTRNILSPANSKIRLAKIKQWIFHNEICLAAWIGHHFQLSVFASLLMVNTLTWNSILPEAVTSLSSQPLPMTAEKQVTGCTKSLVSCRVEIHLWRLIIHISNTGHDMTSCYQVPWGLSVSLLYGWWHTDSSASRSGGG